MKAEIEELEKKTVVEGFWENREDSEKVSKRINLLKGKIKKHNDILEAIEDVKTLNELSIEMEELEHKSEIASSIKKVRENFEMLKLETFLTGQYDKNNAILSLHAGAGGTEAQDWVEMLFRMYNFWAEKNGFAVKTLDILPGDDAGIKSITFLVEGENAHGYLRGEKGVHRLVRISPFDSSGRRHTSFASLDVMPELDDDISVDINPEDLRIDTYRAGGAGGQHVNKTDSAVRITHIPTGVVVSCQNERSQHQNKDTAMKVLMAKLLELKEQENKEKIEDLKGVQLDIAWGSQIRSYVFCPYTMVKDHRTNFEMGNVDAVMDGELNGFIDAYLKEGGKL